MKIQFTLILVLLFNLKIMALEIKTEIIINAPVTDVWNVLTDFKSYPDWNPFIKSLVGDVVVGQKIKVEILEMVFNPKILAYENASNLKWIGSIGFRGIFDGTHSFELHPNADGTTTFIQKEVFKGILVPFFKQKLRTQTKPGFEEMNLALKNRVETNR